MRGRREDCKGLNDNLNRAGIERLRIRKSIRLKYGCIKRSLSISERENGYKVDIYKAPYQPLSNTRQTVLKATDKGQEEGRPCNDKNREIIMLRESDMNVR